MSKAHVDFLSEIYELEPDRPLRVGREGDIVIDDNPYLHRHFLEVVLRDSMVWVANVGSSLTATVADSDGLLNAWLAPGAALPIVFSRTEVWFTAGPTTYEFEIVLADPPYAAPTVPTEAMGETTVGRVALTPDQKLLILLLAEDVLRRGNRSSGRMPSNADAAKRVGWTQTKFNRKLDNVCEKLTRVGVQGLHGGADRLASGRRARLVEYAVASRIVTAADLSDLDAACGAE